MLCTLAEGLRSVTVLLWPYLPASAERLLGALGAPELSLAGAELGAGAIERVSPIESLFPKGPPESAGRVIDSHTHLDLCEPTDAELVAAAERAGVTRMLTVGIDGASCRAALAAAEAFPQVYAASAATRTRPGASTMPTSPSCARWPPTSAAVAIGETRP